MKRNKHADIGTTLPKLILVLNIAT